SAHHHRDALSTGCGNPLIEALSTALDRRVGELAPLHTTAKIRQTLDAKCDLKVASLEMQ
ncbi:MAG TPA: hypothetical protein PK744_06040, partial [Pseudomonadales bacterium]|nr:hypothetical protein [Pseudomonadales bacterium]